MMQERIKELQAFYAMTEIVEEEGESLPGIYQRVIDTIVNSWQYPEVTCGRLFINSREYITRNYQNTSWKQEAPIKVKGSLVGVIEIYYLDQRPSEDEGPFLKEERLLLDSIAERVGHITELWQADEMLKRKTR